MLRGKGDREHSEGRKQGEEGEEEEVLQAWGARASGWVLEKEVEVEVEPLLMNTVCNLAIEIDGAARLEVMESVLRASHCFYSLETAGKTSRKTAQWVPPSHISAYIWKTMEKTINSKSPLSCLQQDACLVLPGEELGIKQTMPITKKKISSKFLQGEKGGGERGRVTQPAGLSTA